MGERYKKVWNDFKDFMGDYMGDVGALELRPPSEEEILNFVCHLRQKGMASSSLWTMYSIVNSIIKAKYSFSLKKYPSVTTALRSMDGDVKKKTKTFTKLEFDMFVENQTICSPYWLVRKVIVIVSYFGGLRHIECDALKIENFSVTDDGIVVTHSRPKKMRDEESRFFVPPRYGAYIQDYLHLVMMDLGKNEGRVWFTGRDTALVACSMGKNTISKVPFEMATLLELDEPEDYSFHSLRSINTSPTAEIGYRLN